jgi:hypothetical protein
VDFGVICAPLLLDAGVGFVQEYQAGSIVDDLKETLALKATVWYFVSLCLRRHDRSCHYQRFRYPAGCYPVQPDVRGLGLGTRIAAMPDAKGSSTRPWVLVCAFGTTARLATRKSCDPNSATGLIIVGIFNSMCASPPCLYLH